MKWLLAFAAGWTLIGPAGSAHSNDHPLYSVILLDAKDERYYSRATAIIAGHEFGYGNGTGTGTSTAGGEDLSPLEWTNGSSRPTELSLDEAKANAAFGDSVVGESRGEPVMGVRGKRVDLNKGWGPGMGGGRYGGRQGRGNTVDEGTKPHAFLWRGSPESGIDLNPPGFSQSTAWAVSADGLAGDGIRPGWDGLTHALFWKGLARTAIDLNPTGFLTSTARGAASGCQVGWGRGAATSGVNHALLWRGTAKYTDLHPIGFDSSEANGAAGRFQVGTGTRLGKQAGLVWRGSAESCVNLHSFLQGVLIDGNPFVWSVATAVDDQGDVVGYGGGEGGRDIGILWRRKR